MDTADYQEKMKDLMKIRGQSLEQRSYALDASETQA